MGASMRQLFGRRKSFCLLPSAFILAGACVTAAAQGYPAKPIRVIVAFAPGGSTDVVFRLLAPRLTEYLGQPVLVDNRPGGGATIGMDLVAKAPADGYTLGVANISSAARRRNSLRSSGASSPAGPG